MPESPEVYHYKNRPFECNDEYFERPEKLLNPNSSLKSINDNLYLGIEYLGNKWIERACEIARQSVENGGGPFGAVILQIDSESNRVLRFWEASNSVTKFNDPTAHAEILAIRSACASLGVFNLGEIEKEKSKLEQPNPVSHCILVSSCEPCPMCYSAIEWARIPELYFAATRFDAAQPGIDFSDNKIYEELKKPYCSRKIKVHWCTVQNSLEAFKLWKSVEKQQY
jgi:tRNA(Arg) A34 adenosine deaminase TadA